MINLHKYVYSLQSFPNKNHIDADMDFWEDIDDDDLEEAIEEYVRDSSDFYESID